MIMKNIRGLILFCIVITITVYTNFFYKKQYINTVSAEKHYDYMLNATQLDMKLGTIFSVFAFGNDAPKVKWFSSDTHVARINSNGQVITKNIGQTIITAKYKQQCKDIIVNVVKKAPQDVLIYYNSSTVAAKGESLNKININTYILTLSKNTYTFTGKHIKPKVTITSVNGTKLTKNKDYTVKYQNNKEAGNAQVLVTGIEDYTGSLVGTYKIVKPESDSSSFSTDENGTTSNANTNYGNNDSTSNTVLTPTSPENSKISSTRTQTYTGSTTKSNSSTNASTKSSKTTTSSSQKKSTSKKKSTSSDTTKNSFTKSKSSTSDNSFSKNSSSTSNSTNNKETSGSTSENISPSSNNNSTNGSTSNGTSTSDDTNNTSDNSTQTDNSSSIPSTTE